MYGTTDSHNRILNRQNLNTFHGLNVDLIQLLDSYQDKANKTRTRLEIKDVLRALTRSTQRN